MKIERTKNASRNIVFGVLQRIYHITMPFVIRTIMIYYMGIEYVGLNGLFTSVLQVLNLAELGVGSAMVFSMYKPIVEDDTVTICALMRLYRTYYRVIGGVIAVVGLTLTPFMPLFIKCDMPEGLNLYVLYLFNLAVTVCSYWLFAYKNSLFQAHQRIDVVSKLTLLINTIFYMLQIVIVVVWRDYYLYTMSFLAMQIVLNFATAIKANKMYPKYKANGTLDKTEVDLINQRIKDLFTAKLGTVVVGSVDTIVISAFLGLTTLAIYQNYYLIHSAVCGFFSIVFSSVLAGMGNSFATETIEKNYGDFKRFTFLVHWLICICCCCFLVLYQPFMEMWVGESLLLPMSCVVLFCIYFYVHELSMIWATAKDAAGIWHEDRFRPLVGASANLIMNLTLVNYIGIYGILLSTILSYVFISMPWLVRNLFKVIYKRSAWEYVKSLFGYVVVTVFSCVLVWCICEKIPYEGVIGIVTRFIVAMIISNGIQVCMFYRKREFAQVLDLVKRVLGRT